MYGNYPFLVKHILGLFLVGLTIGTPMLVNIYIHSLEIVPSITNFFQEYKQQRFPNFSKDFVKVYPSLESIISQDTGPLTIVEYAEKINQNVVVEAKEIKDTKREVYLDSEGKVHV
jgi:hypothetical protein